MDVYAVGHNYTLIHMYIYAYLYVCAGKCTFMEASFNCICMHLYNNRNNSTWPPTPLHRAMLLFHPTKLVALPVSLSPTSKTGTSLVRTSVNVCMAKSVRSKNKETQLVKFPPHCVLSSQRRPYICVLVCVDIHTKRHVHMYILYNTTRPYTYICIYSSVCVSAVAVCCIVKAEFCVRISGTTNFAVELQKYIHPHIHISMSVVLRSLHTKNRSELQSNGGK